MGVLESSLPQIAFGTIIIESWLGFIELFSNLLLLFLSTINVPEFE